MRQRRINGDAVRELRQALGLLQAEVAKQAGISAAYLTNIEAGRVQYRRIADMPQRLAAALGCSVAAITYLTDETESEAVA
jgi:transcriptional regulator with XRE-family HTH domain